MAYSYQCGKCHKDVNIIRYDINGEIKMWMCNSCYFKPHKSVLKSNNNVKTINLHKRAGG